MSKWCFAVHFEFDGKSDLTVPLAISLDSAAMQAKQQAAAEAAAKAEALRVAQEQAAAEAAAAAQAEAERIAAEEAAAQAAEAEQAAQEDENTVYVASSGNGKKYHSYSGCSNMKGTRSLSVSEAENLGFTPCKKCW